MPNFTQALYDARELAMERMQDEAEELRGRRHRRRRSSTRAATAGESHVIEFFAVGTAVTPTSDDHAIPPPSFVLSLNDASQETAAGF